MDTSLLTVFGGVAVAWLAARWLTNVLRRLTGVRFGPAAALEQTGAFGTSRQGITNPLVILYDCRGWWKRLLFLAGFGSCAGSYDGGEMYPTMHLFDLGLARIAKQAAPRCRVLYHRGFVVDEIGEDGISLTRYHGPVHAGPD